MTGFLDLARVFVPTDLAEAAQEHLRETGEQGFEGLAIWAGLRSGNVFTVEQTIIPKQESLRLKGGLCYRVDADELHKINCHLYEHGNTLIAQLHSHPDEAYHSPVDDDFAIATTLGAFSFVVPDFAVRPFSLLECAVYRLMPGDGWVRQQDAEVQALFELVD